MIVKKFIRLITAFCVLTVCSGIVSSCTKDYISTSYMISFSIDMNGFTQPKNIPDPEIRETYLQMVTDINNLGSVTNNSWQVEVVNCKYDKEDRKAEEMYDSHLAEIKEMETKCRNIIDNLEIREGSSFQVKVDYTLKRWSPAVTLKEYTFELRYN